MRRFLALLDLSADARAGAVPVPAAERALLAGGMWLTAASMAFLAVAHLVNHLVFDLSSRFFDAGHDGGLFTFASAMATVLCGALALALAVVWPRRVLLLAGLAVLLAYLAVDDMYAGHERIAERLDLDLLGIEQTGRVLWPLVFVPLLGTALAGLLAIASALSAPVRRLMHGGLLLLVVAIALEMASIALVNAGFDGSTTPYEVQVALEEAAELGGWMLIAVALAAAFLAGGPAGRR